MLAVTPISCPRLGFFYSNFTQISCLWLGSTLSDFSSVKLATCPVLGCCFCPTFLLPSTLRTHDVQDWLRSFPINRRVVGDLAAFGVASQLLVIRGGSYHTDRRFLTYQNFHQVGSLDRDMADSRLKFLFLIDLILAYELAQVIM